MEEVGLVSYQKLTGSSQNRVWQLFLYEEKYLSASNTVDSVVSVGPISNFQHNNHSISFSIGDDVLLNQSNVHLSALYSDGLLQRIFPGLGTWSVGAGGKQLTISPHPRDSDGNGAGGVFEVVYSQDLSANPIFPYPRSLELNLSRSLANNRKMQLFMVLGSF